MHRSRFGAVSFLFIAVTLLGGCGDAPVETEGIPPTPDGTARWVMDGLQQRRPVVLWEAMPPSYRQDVALLLADFEDNMDPALFDRVVAVSRRAVVVLQSKKDLILATETVTSTGMDPVTLDSLWESYVHAMDAVLASELTRLDAYPGLDVEQVLRTTGAEVVTHLSSFSPQAEGADTLQARLADLDATGVELTEESGDTATIRISPPNGKATDVVMVRIEDRWVPEDLAEQWPEVIADARARIAFLGTEEANQAKVQILFGLGMVEGFVNQIEGLEQPEDLDNLIGGLMGNLMRQGGAPPAPSSAAVEG